MLSKGHLETYNHIAIAARDGAKAVQNWARLYDFAPPPLGGGKDMKRIYDFVQFPSYYRGEYWKADISQAVLYQTCMQMLEIKQPGSGDAIREFVEKNGNGTAYFGIVEGDNRDAFVERLENEFGAAMIHDMVFPAPAKGDWCLMETENVLGINLCIKKDGTINQPDPAVLPDLESMVIVVPDLETAVRAWRQIFEIVEPLSVSLIFSGQEKTAALILEAPFSLYLVERDIQGPFGHFCGKRDHGIACVSLKNERPMHKELLPEMSRESTLSFALNGKHWQLFQTADALGTDVMIEEEYT